MKVVIGLLHAAEVTFSRSTLMGGMDSIIAEFLAESVENLDQLDQDLVSLEKNPEDREIFGRIFRTIHTIKGTCGFLAFGTLESVTHVGESLLGQLRDGELDLTPDITTDLLAMIDAVRAILANIDATGAEGDNDYGSLISRLLSHDTTASPDEEESKPEAKKKAAAAGKGKKKTAPPRAAKSAPATPAKAKKRPVAKKTPATQPKEESAPAPAAPEPEEAPEDLELMSVPAVAESNIRVDVRVLDHLMNLVGELVLARNQLVQHLAGSGDGGVVSSSQRLDSITSELQEAVMRTRMQPISSIWRKLPRFTRDLALKFGKEVEIEMEGEETDLDKSVIEAIKGSLLHLVRNSVDHGIESPDVREERGKPRAGKLKLRAHHDGGSVVIEVRDDGSGLDQERIIDRALEAGLITKEQGLRLSRQEIDALVFQPGFSTASEVTNISGRGVGLDVVRANVESMGGSIELQSEPGQSTSFRVKIPLTLAIVSVLLVKAESHRIAIPQASVVELIRLEEGKEGSRIEDLGGVPVFRLRGKLLPLVFLDHELGLDPNHEVPDGANIVVLQGDDRQFGLVVAGVEDSQEIVVKPLGSMLAGLPFAGATILGDGQIALILDVFRLGLAAGVVSEKHAHTVATQISKAVEKRQKSERLVYLHGEGDERLALDFNQVNRLEYFPRTSIEHVGNQLLVQYGDDILQLVEIQQALPERRHEPRSPSERLQVETVPVVVCTVRGRRIGLIAHRIVDIVDEDLRARRLGSRDGVKNCAVIRDRVTEILDIESLIRLSDPEFFDRPIDQE
jgi:two-component system chemotaxis sensor kinase CheA